MPILSSDITSLSALLCKTQQQNCASLSEVVGNSAGTPACTVEQSAAVDEVHKMSDKN